MRDKRAEQTATERILLTGDHAAFRKALAFVPERQPGLDVAVVDPMLPDGDGTEVIHEPREANPGFGILTLSADRDPGRALEAGADETLGKDASLTSIVAAVRRLAGA